MTPSKQEAKKKKKDREPKRRVKGGGGESNQLKEIQEEPSISANDQERRRRGFNELCEICGHFEFIDAIGLGGFLPLHHLDKSGREDKRGPFPLDAEFSFFISQEVPKVDVEETPIVGKHDVVVVSVSHSQYVS